MSQAPTDASSPDRTEDQTHQNGHVIRPDSNWNYQCPTCLKSFPCPEPYQHHALQHDDAIQRIYVGSKHLDSLKRMVTAFHRVYCHRGTHFVRVTVSNSLGSISTIRQIDEEEELTFEEFLKEDFISTEIYEEAVKKMKELDARCCRPMPSLPTLSSKTWVNWLRSCFACIPTLRRPRSRRWSSISNTKSTSRYPSKEDLTTNNGHEPTANDPMSTTNTVLPENITAVIAVDSFYSTSEGVRGYGVAVATRSDTIILLQGVGLGELLLHTRITNQLRGIVGDYVYKELLEYEKKRMDISRPVYRGILPDGLPIGAGEETRLEDCLPVLKAHVYSVLDL